MKQAPKFKLGLRNRTAADKLVIRTHFTRRLAALPPEKRPHVRLEPLQAACDASEAAHVAVATLRMNLTAAITRRNDCDAEFDRVTESAAIGFSFSVKSEAEYFAVGLDVQNRNRPLGLAAAPTRLRSEPVPGMATGAVMLRWKRPLRRCYFYVEHTPDARASMGWTRVSGSLAAKLVIRDLEPGQLYWFRVRAHNNAGAGPWCEALQARAGF